VKEGTAAFRLKKVDNRDQRLKSKGNKIRGHISGGTLKTETEVGIPKKQRDEVKGNAFINEASQTHTKEKNRGEINGGTNTKTYHMGGLYSEEHRGQKETSPARLRGKKPPEDKGSLIKNEG